MRALVSMVGRNRTAHAILAAGLIAVGATVAASDKDKRAEWRHYLGGQDSASYSSLTQISRSNVTELEVAWTYRAGPNSRLRFNPIVVDDVMYVMGKDRAIVAIDAATGKELVEVRTRPAVPARYHRPGHQLLGEQGSIAAPAVVCGGRLSAGR